MDRHERTHTPLTPEERLNCPARGCGRIREHGFYGKDHLHEHFRREHPKDIPKHNRRRDPPGDIGRYNVNLEAPGERLRSLSSQSPYVAEKSPGTASGIKKSVSHDMGEVDKESPSSTDLESIRDVQVAPEPKIAHGKSISQSVKPGYEHNGLNPNKTERRSSTISADVERSTMTITGEYGVQDAVKPAKIVLEPDNEALPSILDHPIHTTPLTVMDADDELMSSLYDDRSEQAQYGDDSSVVDS